MCHGPKLSLKTWVHQTSSRLSSVGLGHICLTSSVIRQDPPCLWCHCSLCWENHLSRWLADHMHLQCQSFSNLVFLMVQHRSVDLHTTCCVYGACGARPLWHSQVFMMRLKVLSHLPPTAHFKSIIFNIPWCASLGNLSANDQGLTETFEKHAETCCAALILLINCKWRLLQWYQVWFNV